MPIEPTTNAAPYKEKKAHLGLWDAVSIIVGIVVGTSIFRSPTMIFREVPGPVWAMGLWVVGGIVSWCGAVCYAELATAYPRDGGDYEYLSRAFGRWCGFLFAWAQLTVIISGNIGIMAYAFSDYSVEMWPALKSHAVWLVLAPVLVLTVVNLLGIVAGRWAQNLLSVLKVMGLTAIVLAALWAGAIPQGNAREAAETSPNIGLALVFVLYAFGGWAHAAYVAAEVRDQRRNLPKALIFGIAGITLIYLAVNGAYLAVLGFDGARASATPASEVMKNAFGIWGGRAVSVLVMLSALGAINGMILTGARVYAVWGEDFPALAWLAKRRHGGPAAAIIVQSIIASLLVLLVGTQAGRDGFDAVLQSMRLDGLPWARFESGFETLVTGTAPVYWGLSFLGGLSLIILRKVDREAERPYKVPLYPLPVIVFCAACVFMLNASLDYARWLALIGVVPLTLGAVLYLLLSFWNRSD